MQRFTTLALILAAASTAQADDLTTKYRNVFQKYGQFAYDIKDNPAATRIDNKAAGDCTKEIAKAKAEGVAADAVFSFDYEDKPKNVSLADVQQTVCAPFDRAYRIALVAHAIDVAQDRNFWLTQVNMWTMDPAEAADIVKEANACMAGAAQVDELGVGDTELLLHNENGNFELKMADAKAKVCEPLAKSASAFAKDVKKATDDREAATTGPFKKAGIGGDKLDVCAHYFNSNIRGVGGGVLTPAQIKKANVLFVRLGPATDTGLYTLQRFMFKGDKLVSQTDKEFVRLPGAGAYK